jgi:opacity protein-like surface antigen
MARQWMKFLYAVSVVSGMLVMCAGVSRAFNGKDEISREGTKDVYIFSNFVKSDPIQYKSGPANVPIDVDDTYLWGFGFGGFFSDQLAMRFELGFGDTVLHARTGGGDINRDAWLSTGMFNLDYALTLQRLTPYITGGIGWQYLEAEVATVGFPVWVWDPWYGWILSYPTAVYTEWDFAYQTGIGLRWDVGDGLFLRVGYDLNWVDYHNASRDALQQKLGLVIGSNF